MDNGSPSNIWITIHGSLGKENQHRASNGGEGHSRGSRCKSLSEEVTFEWRSQGGQRRRDNPSRPQSLKRGSVDIWDHLLCRGLSCEWQFVE